LALLMLVAVVHKALSGASQPVYVAGMLASNLVIGWIVIEILRGTSRRQRGMEEGPAVSDRSSELIKAADD